MRAGIDGRVLVDLDDTIIEVHGYAKQGSGYGYSGVRGLNALIATATTEKGAPVIIGQRLRKGSCGSPRGAARLVGDTLRTLNRLRSPDAAATPLVRVSWNQPGEIMRALDAGAYGVICPMINDATECAAFVQASRYPPDGFRSSGPTRAAGATLLSSV